MNLVMREAGFGEFCLDWRGEVGRLKVISSVGAEGLALGCSRI